jgi:outer membrane lipopolysaccharide assembly protein LptE/RlpB
MKKLLLLLSFSLLTGCTVHFNNRSIVNHLDQKAEYDGQITNHPTGSGPSSVAAERTTATSVSESGEASASKVAKEESRHNGN